MGLTMYGRFTPEKREYIENLTTRETWTEARTLAEDGEDSVYFEQGNFALSRAIDFLRVLEKSKSERVGQIYNEATAEEKEVEGRGFLINIEQAQEIYRLIKDIPSRYDELLYDFVRIRPEKIVTVEQVAPNLVEESRPYAAPRDKEVVKIISKAQWQTDQVIKFFELAAGLEREVWINY